ncbi:tRNA-uridine aminocarboxypropyltransferase [Thalassomonas sp. RHCl1]|uniref:tRNA-uridine aminocarboxypropyltransferase n=1 Tax=Thalassomonas sp. RHCl1 TaxID=2995320 RepID=UPI00248AFD8C|nr:tRNA-uridine aminocarboxypropyltransferase [Thalassomonas sp. RHCl1]
MHAVHRLYQYRKSLCTTVFAARGQRVKRCQLCQLAQNNCICDLAVKGQSQAGFLLLMYDTEVLKPSNTGRLIGDVIPDTFAYLWSRTEENPELLALLQDEQWQPYVVFPAQYAEENRPVFQKDIPCENGKRPLFIMLDGSWREAKKIFRKSPYLAKLPMVSFNLEDNAVTSRYQLRSAGGENQLATAEVAARVLAMWGEHANAKLLDLWFDVFSYQYQKSVCQSNKGNADALDNFTAFVEQQQAV